MSTAPVSIALVGDYDPSVIAHQAIPRALDFAARAAGVAVSPTWLHTAELGGCDISATLGDFAAVWVVPASPYADMDAALAAIRFARETGRPFLGTCGGFQHAVIEYARNVLGMSEAEHAETSPGAAVQVIAPLTCSLVEKSGTIHLRPGSTLQATYGADRTEEAYHCNYGVNPRYAALFNRPDGLRVSATDDAGDVRAVELSAHPFFIATLFQPERSALAGATHPLITAFVRATQR